MVRAVLLDFWGTLADGPATLWDDALRRALAAARVDAPFERFQAAWLASKATEDGPAEPDLEGRFLRAFKTLGKPARTARPAAKEASARCVQEIGAAARLFPDALPALRALPPDLRVGVVSNFPDATVFARTLSRLGLSGRLDAAVCSAEAGARKPDPAPFLLALERMKVGPAEAVMVGDGEDDVAGATAAGIRAVFLARAGQAAPPGATATISGLAELAETLRRLAANA
ncbi:MAG TPA: HAD family hydrolase [Candidatus Thermoplasmatota archaeon]|nr:HAD family hydrolase [Candidatus Thermoplasmatota archaeon]